MKFTDAFKLLLPSWNFFADFDAVPRLEVRFHDLPEGLGEWMDLFPPTPEPGILRVFLNPVGNRRLLEQAQLDRAADFFDAQAREPDCGAGIPPNFSEESLEHQSMLRGICSSRIRELGLWKVSSRAGRFSFRLSLVEATGRIRQVFTEGPVPMVGYDSTDS